MTKASIQTPEESTPPRTIELRLHEVTPRLLTVVDVIDLSAVMRRIVFGGEDMSKAVFPFSPMAVSDHVKLVFPERESGELHLPAAGPDRLIMPEGRPRPIFRDYTVRSFDANTQQISIDFVIHDHGVAGRWAASAAVGQRLGVLGPRGSHHYPTGFAHYLIAGDETALPAIARWLEELPETLTCDVFASVDSAKDEIELPHHPGAVVRYLHRSVLGATALEDAVVSWRTRHEDLFVWAAGEAASMRTIRRHVRDALGVPKENTDIDGYWKKGVEGLDHHAADDDD
ncbi:siderophore-interacting protein [Paenarthrobacter sp. NPDC089989]|uniref:siderophore-interacting protein n=1 Tax=unclassified Paenarthrobacter TaxID=2634190 RepID=UPI0038249ED7